MPAITDVTVGTTSTSITTGAETGSRPMYLQNESDQVITLSFASGDDYDLDPGEWIQVIPGMVVTGTSPSGGALLQVLRGVIPDEGASHNPAYDSESGALLSWRTNPERNYTLQQQEEASSKADGTTNYYIDFEGCQDLSVQIQNTAGASGTNTYKIWASAEAGGQDADSATYFDVGSALFGAASWTADAYIVNSKKFRAKFIKVEVVRSGDGGSTDGAWTIDIQGG